MTPPSASLALLEMFDAFHSAPDLCKPIWRASFEVSCLAWGMIPAREWERLVKLTRRAEGGVG